MRKHKEGEDMNYTISNEKLTLVISSKGGRISVYQRCRRTGIPVAGRRCNMDRQRTESISLYRSNDRKKL